MKHSRTEPTASTTWPQQFP